MDLISFKKAQNVQKQLDQAIAAGDQLAEVQQARVNATGKVYTNLKERLDTEVGNTKSVVEEVARKLEDSESQTQTLTHGLNVLNADQPSPLKVEFYGNTLVNLLGKDGNFESGDTWIDMTSTTHTFTNDSEVGERAIKVVATGGGSTAKYAYKEYNANFNSGDYLLFAGNIKTTTTSNTLGLRILFLDSAGNTINSYAIPKTANIRSFGHAKIIVPANVVKYRIAIDGVGDTHETVADAVRLYKIPQSTYDKIGVSLTDADVERLFPYVDSVQHVKNPVVKVSGSQLLPTNSGEWEQGSISSATGANVTTTDRIRTKDYITVAPNTNYTFSIRQGNFYYVQYDKSNNFISASTVWSSSLTSTFTTTANTTKIKAVLRIADGTTLTGEDILTIKPILNLGTTVKPFTPKNDSYLYAETVLAGLPNSDKKDILSFNEDKRRWEKTKWFEDVVLDGSWSWVYNSEHQSGFKRVEAPNISSDILLNNDNSTVVKYSGSLLFANDSHLFTDRYNVRGAVSKYTFAISISNTDSGWTDAMTPTVDMIKAYFNGWKYKGDGTTHSWVSIVDGTTAPATNTLAFVANPANKPTGYKNYFLSYMLSSPIVEPVNVEGDMSISGDAQVEVSSGLINREEVVVYEGANTYQINYVSTNSQLDHKSSKIVKIYKNGKDDTHNWTIKTNSAYGNERAEILKTESHKYDSTAQYSVTYEILDKHSFTTNLNEVIANYSSSLKSSFQQVVAKQSDIATEVSIQARSIIDLYAKLKAMEV